MICEAPNGDKLEFATYDMKEGCNKKISPFYTGNVYDDLDKAKAACHKAAGKVSTKGMSKKQRAKLNLGNMRNIIKTSK